MLSILTFVSHWISGCPYRKQELLVVIHRPGYSLRDVKGTWQVTQLVTGTTSNNAMENSLWYFSFSDPQKVKHADNWTAGDRPLISFLREPEAEFAEAISDLRKTSHASAGFQTASPVPAPAPIPLLPTRNMPVSARASAATNCGATGTQPERRFLSPSGRRRAETVNRPALPTARLPQGRQLRAGAATPAPDPRLPPTPARALTPTPHSPPVRPRPGCVHRRTRAAIRAEPRNPAASPPRPRLLLSRQLWLHIVGEGPGRWPSARETDSHGHGARQLSARQQAPASKEAKPPPSSGDLKMAAA
jgi:hypothetical protein